MIDPDDPDAGWRHIDSAPRKGKLVSGLDGNDSFGAMSWNEETERWEWTVDSGFPLPKQPILWRPYRGPLIDKDD